MCVDEDDGDISPHAHLIQQFSPAVLALPPVSRPVAVPQQLIVRSSQVQHQELPRQRVGPPPGGRVCCLNLRPQLLHKEEQGRESHRTGK